MVDDWFLGIHPILCVNAIWMGKTRKGIEWYLLNDKRNNLLMREQNWQNIAWRCLRIAAWGAGTVKQYVQTTGS